MSVMVLCRPVPADRAFCNHLQNVGATTYKNVLQLPAKKACKKQFKSSSSETPASPNLMTQFPLNLLNHQHIRRQPVYLAKII
jgi:hypothetical protein